MCFPIIQVLLDIIALVGFAVVLEPLWGVKEFMVSTKGSSHDNDILFLRYSVVLLVCPVCSVWPLYVLLYMHSVVLSLSCEFLHALFCRIVPFTC